MGGGATRSFFVLLDIGVGYFGDYVFLFCFVSTTTSKWFTTSRVLDVTPVSFCVVFTCFVCLFVCFFYFFLLPFHVCCGVLIVGCGCVVVVGGGGDRAREETKATTRSSARQHRLDVLLYALNVCIVVCFFF